MSEPTDAQLAKHLRDMAEHVSKHCICTPAEIEKFYIAAQRLDARSREWKPIHDEDHE